MDYKEWKNKKFRGRYEIVDCEHDGDIASAENDVISSGGKVAYTHWDGCDCGEAYVYWYCETKEDYEKTNYNLNLL